MWFESWESLFKVILAAVINYSGLVLFLRVSGKRTLAQFNAFDFIVTVALGSALASSIISSSTVPVATSLVALLSLIVMQYIVSWTGSRFSFLQKIIKSTPSLLMFNGEFLHKNLRSERLTDIEVLSALRENGIGDINDVQAVILETTGEISVITAEQKNLSTITQYHGLEIPKNTGKKL